MQTSWEGPSCHPLPWDHTLASAPWLSSYLHPPNPHHHTVPQHQPAHPNCTRKWKQNRTKETATLRFTPRCPLPWPCRPPVPDTSSQGLEEDTCASACHTFPCNWSCHCIMSQRRHHPVNKNGGMGEEREEAEGKQKKKKLRKVGLEVELKRHKRINQTCVCVFFFSVLQIYVRARTEQSAVNN